MAPSVRARMHEVSHDNDRKRPGIGDVNTVLSSSTSCQVWSLNHSTVAQHGRPWWVKICWRVAGFNLS